MQQHFRPPVPQVVMIDGPAGPLEGRIEEARIYDRVKTCAELTELIVQ